MFELREHHRKRAERGLPKIGDLVRCERCGSETARRSKRGQHYCPACSTHRRAETFQSFRGQHRSRLNERDRERSKDPRRNLDKRMKWSIWDCLKGRKAGRSWESLVGYTAEELAIHIERQFLPKMTWQNMGTWHIDHIVPKAAFNYQTAEDEAFKACWALSNLRPLWGTDNIQKSAKRTHLV